MVLGYLLNIALCRQYIDTRPDMIKKRGLAGRAGQVVAHTYWSKKQWPTLDFFYFFLFLRTRKPLLRNFWLFQSTSQQLSYARMFVSHHDLFALPG